MQSLFGDDEPENVVKIESRTEGSQVPVVKVDTLGLELEARIKKLEEVFAYLKAKKMVVC